MFKQITLLTLAITSLNSFAGSVDRYDYKTQTFKNSDQVSALKEFKITTNNYKVLFTGEPEPSFGTTLYAEYTTKNVDQLEEYAVVQYIQGCQFASKENEQGAVEKYMSTSRQFFDGLVPFKHPKLVIDSVDVDPIYNSNATSRHGSYRWNEVQGSYARATEHYYQNQFPDTPSLYVRDMPSGAYKGSFDAMNVSLKFEACIVKTSDVPKVATPDLDLRGKALSCFKWSSSFVYNHKEQKYESPEAIDPYCLQ